jgi:uncharacterized protein YukE
VGDREVWVKDINDLRDLGRRDMKNVASDVQNTIGELNTLTLAAAFGENQDIQRQIMTAYENARAAIIKQVGHAQKGMSDSGDAIAKVAGHYAHLESTMSH